MICGVRQFWCISKTSIGKAKWNGPYQACSTKLQLKVLEKPVSPSFITPNWPVLTKEPTAVLRKPGHFFRSVCKSPWPLAFSRAFRRVPYANEPRFWHFHLASAGNSVGLAWFGRLGRKLTVKMRCPLRTPFASPRMHYSQEWASCRLQPLYHQEQVTLKECFVTDQACQ